MPPRISTLVTDIAPDTYLRMKRFLALFFCLCATTLLAQDLTISGKVTDEGGLPLSFVNVLVFNSEGDSTITGTTTEEDGTYIINELETGNYKLNFSYVGFETKEDIVKLTSNKNLGTIVLKESAEMLEEAVVTAKLPNIVKKPGMLIFNVENTSLSIGSTFDLLKKTPGVLVIDENIRVKFASPVIYINGKRVYLSDSEIRSLLENTDAAVIKSIEVITSPSAKYDAEAGTVLNIITTKAISVGYKGSVNTTYEQGVYPKYQFGTSHFYKNDWLNIYGSYNFNPRKDYKKDENYIRFFNPDGSTNSIWTTDFARTTRSKSHQGNVVADFTLTEKQSLSVSSNISFTPSIKYNNTGITEIENAQQQLDSTFTTASDFDNDTQNLSFNTDYKIELNEKGSSLVLSANYVDYKNKKQQQVATNYYLPNGDFIRNNSFATIADQATKIFTAQTDFTAPTWEGTIEAGVKYSGIDTNNKLDYYNIENRIRLYNQVLSDDFNYTENIYAGYANYNKTFGKFDVTAGLRGEYTDIVGNSRSLISVKNQEYFELFPKASIDYALNENNNFGIIYSRSMQRPRYQSLNPFKYFINEHNYNTGNPNLVPAIEDKITLSYSHKGKWFFEAYYQNVKDNLSVVTFQDNERRNKYELDFNLIKEFQYSLDIVYVNPMKDWWYLHLLTSTYYLENEFYAIASVPETYSNNTFGFFAQMYSGLTLSKKASFTSDITAMYISNFIMGSYDMKNQFNLSISFRKEMWDKRASITAGVDDIFNTQAMPLSSKYYNQDNSFNAQSETRLFRLSFRYNFGNARLRDNNKSVELDESDRLNSN